MYCSVTQYLVCRGDGFEILNMLSLPPDFALIMDKFPRSNGPTIYLITYKVYMPREVGDDANATQQE